MNAVRPRPSILALCVVLVILSISGCSVPKHMHVRAGVDPRNQDDDVRFRTTYYFRVFDNCQVGEGAFFQVEEEGEPADAPVGIPVPQIDSLYRFRMTGKANALYTDVHFESGTLKSYEIDPLGANVVLDQNTGQFQFKSQKQAEDDARQLATEAELLRFIKLKKELVGREGEGGEEENKGAITKLNTLIEQQIEIIGGRTITTSSPSEPPPTPTSRCPDGSVARRGFQILGPEGWRTFDQDERLLMAMATDAKPIIGALKEISARVLQEKQGNSALLVPLLEARLIASETERHIDQLKDTDESAADVVDSIMAAFGVQQEPAGESAKE